MQPLKSLLLKLYLKQLSHSLELFLRRQNVLGNPSTKRQKGKRE